MALKSIIEIDVQDESFQAFNALFDRYQQQLKTLPGEWAKIANGTASAKSAFEDLVTKAVAQTAQSKLQALAKIKLDPSQIIEAEKNNNPVAGDSGQATNLALAQQALGAGTYTIFHMDRFGDTRGRIGSMRACASVKV